MSEQKKFNFGDYSLERFGHLYFWSDAEKAKFIADATCLIFLLAALTCALMEYFPSDDLHLSYENLNWAISTALLSAFIFFLIRIVSKKSIHSAFFSKASLISNMVFMSICLPLLFACIGIFDGFCWSVLFIYAAVGFVVVEPKYIFATQIATLVVLISISFLDELLPFRVRAYMVSVDGYIDSFSHVDLIFKWTVMVITTFISMVALGYLTGAWQRREQDLRTISFKDELTDLRNRRSILEGLTLEFKNSKDAGQALSVAMVDLDFFKKINDTHGHQFGDKALRFVADKAKQICRGHDLLGRYGGEEFLIVFPTCQVEQAVRVLDRLREALANEAIKNDQGEEVFITLSAGVSQISVEDFDMSSLIQRADEALYKAKEHGRNRVERA